MWLAYWARSTARSSSRTPARYRSAPWPSTVPTAVPRTPSTPSSAGITTPTCHVITVKGAPDNEGRVEIWTPPKPIDPNHRATKASRYGVQVHIVGTAKAKDLILGWAQEGGRVRLAGAGPGQMYWYQGVRDDFYEQMFSEIKIPDRNNPRRHVWKARTDRRNEALDATVYAVYLSRHLRLHLRRQWDVDETVRGVEVMTEVSHFCTEIFP